jgi:hypothetical protein
MLKFLNKLVRERFLGKSFIRGQWYGNDTIWRTVLDLNLILLYGDSNGKLQITKKPRQVITVGDMVIAGEKQGPIHPSPKPLGIILASNNCVVFDYVFCKIAGFEYNLIPTVKNSVNNKYLLNESLNDIRLYSNNSNYCDISLPDIQLPDDWMFIPNSV